MNSNRLFAVIVARMLTLPEHALAHAQVQVGSLYDLDGIETEGRVGAAVGDGGPERVPLRQWIQEQRHAGMTSVSVVVLENGSDDDDDEDEDEDEDEDDEGDDRLPHLMAAFAGGLTLCVRVNTADGGADYIVGTVTGPLLCLTPANFIELVHLQKDPGFYWPDVLDEINQFHRCNGREEIDAEALQDHLLSSEGSYDWEYMGDQIFREMQVEAFTCDESFVIPLKFTNLLREVRSCIDVEPFVWLEPIDDDVSGEQLLRLIEAQEFSAKVWKIVADRSGLEEKLGDSVELGDFPELAAERWPDYLRALPDAAHCDICNVLIEVVRLECTRLGIQPRIPDALGEVFGPDEEERRRLHYRGRLQHDLGWAIRHVEQPTRLQVIDRVDEDIPSHPVVGLVGSRQQFLGALIAIRNFARRVDSPFSVHFDLAWHLADNATEQSFASLRARGSDYPSAYWDHAQKVVGLLEAIGCSPQCVLGLAAISVADVFGGMGSWNDQGFDGADERLYHDLSAALFTALNRYFEALASTTASPRTT